MTHFLSSTPPSPIGFRVERLQTVDSTNSYLKAQAALGAPHGLVVTAETQTGGRGRFGRSFQSPAGKGLYCSVLLRPQCPVSQLPHLTPWAAVAVCRAVEAITPLRPRIKWINDLLLEGKKLCGILTEADISPDGTVTALILGIGLNLTQQEEDFTPDVAAMATSLTQHLPHPPSQEEMLTALLNELKRMWTEFPARQADYLADYRVRCATLGQWVTVTTPGESRTAFAHGLTEDFALLVDFPDGSTQALHSGEVSLHKSP